MVTVEEAVEFLEAHFEGALENDYQEGKHDMAKALSSQFNLSSDNAHDLVDKLEHDNSIRYIRGNDPGYDEENNGETVEGIAVLPNFGTMGPGMTGSVTGGSFVAAPLADNPGKGVTPNDYVRYGGGYWSFGRNEGSGFAE